MSGPSVGDVISGRYEIKGEPRRFPGYTGYRAFDREVEVEVSLWWVHREMYPAPLDRATFLRAAAEAKAMKNDHARRLYDAAELGDFVYATAQLATGERLQDRVARGEALTDDQLMGYAASLCEALARAHDAGFVHGRLVPQDVVTVSGLLKVGGIGLWHWAGERSRAVWGGARRYVAPEAWTPARLGPRADVFSAAVILAELASGGGGALWNKTGEVRELKDELALARSDLATELIAAMEADPARRVDSPRALLVSLRAALGHALPTEKLTAVDPVPRPTNGKSEAPIPSVDERGPTVEIAAIDNEIAESEATAHYIRKAPAADPGDFPDAELAEPPKPAAPPPRRVTPPPIPTAPPPNPPRPPDVRNKTSDELPMPLSAAPSRQFDAPPLQEIAEANLPTTPFNRPVPVPPQQFPLAPKRKVWPYVAVAGAVAVAVAIGAWFALTELFGDERSEAASPRPGAGARAQAAEVAPADASSTEPVVVAPAPEVQTGPCPAGMTQVESFCIDVHESPGAGRLPETGMTYAMADKACADRGARLCKPDEWERACRGPEGRSFPYGSAYRRTRCNADEGGKGEIGATGSYDCTSSEGVHDMSGNVAEWVVGGRPRGGSGADGTDGRCSNKRRVDKDRAYDDVGYRCCADPK